MRLTNLLYAGLLCGVAGTGFACNMPPLVAIPAKDKIGDQTAQVSADVKAYFDAMNTYTTCLQAELTSAGPNASPLLKAVITQRNNAAVAEATAVQKLYNANVLGAGAAAPAAGP